MARKRSSTIPETPVPEPTPVHIAEEGDTYTDDAGVEQPIAVGTPFYEVLAAEPAAPSAPRPTLREQVEDWFTYHQPTTVTAPKYAAITTARETAEAVVLSETSGRNEPNFARVNDAIKAFALVIVDHAPDNSADTTAAIRCARLARNAANALLRRPGDGQLTAICLANLYAAQWQANAAIALGGR